MAHPKARFVVGIDLGTTNIVVAFSEINADGSVASPAVFPVLQLVGAGEVARKPMLPAFRYHPQAEEFSASDMQLPWQDDANASAAIPGECTAVIGEWAMVLGANTLGRQVQSAKSWLSHRAAGESGSDAILPWGAPAGVDKVSPVTATASYLKHVKSAWDFEYKEDTLENQQLVITVPASFDEDARSRTLDAAMQAGLHNVKLLEEPQAVVYDWYSEHQEGKAGYVLAPNDCRLLMVCDVGGGTTDLSLIEVSKPAGDSALSLTRVGVGDHLMLGGDNIDLALAYMAEQRLNLGKKLSPGQFAQLISQTRQAKETLLGANGKSIGQATVTLVGSGSRLFAASKSCHLSYEDVESLLLDGFFPLVDLHDRPINKRTAVVELGLPYASDPAMSKHFAAFITDHKHACEQALPEGALAVPDALLLNGGAFKSPVVENRVERLFTHWRAGNAPSILPNGDPQLSVAKGAVAYGKALLGEGLKIAGGAARTYFLKQESTGNAAQAVCLLPSGTPEEHELILEQAFELTFDTQVAFQLVSCNIDTPFNAGQLYDIDERFTVLPPLITTIVSPQKGLASMSVHLSVELSEVGVLQLACTAAGTENTAGDNRAKWLFDFQARGADSHAALALPPEAKPAAQLIRQVFDKLPRGAKRIKPKDLRRALELLLGAREQWDVSVARFVCDELLACASGRVRSQQHERSWLNLTGFCVRPGFGDSGDTHRIEALWRLYEDFLAFEKETQSWIEWWTLWRRLAGGLSAEQQAEIFEGVSPYADPQYLTNRKVQSEAKLISYADTVRLVSSLERVSVDAKAQLGEHLLYRLLNVKSEPAVSWWALGRIAARCPLYGDASNVLPKALAQKWLATMLEQPWANTAHIAFACVMIARKTGDASRDIDSELVTTLGYQLKKHKAPAIWHTLINEVVELDSTETQRLLGDDLPIGLAIA